jgi:hypothetical protein
MQAQLKKQIKIQLTKLEELIPSKERHLVNQIQRTFGETRQEYATLQRRLNASEDSVHAMRGKLDQIELDNQRLQHIAASTKKDSKRSEQQAQELSESQSLLVSVCSSLANFVAQEGEREPFPKLGRIRLSHRVHQRATASKAYAAALAVKAIETACRSNFSSFESRLCKNEHLQTAILLEEKELEDGIVAIIIFDIEHFARIERFRLHSNISLPRDAVLLKNLLETISQTVAQTFEYPCFSAFLEGTLG